MVSLARAGGIEAIEAVVWPLQYILMPSWNLITSNEITQKMSRKYAMFCNEQAD
jgi:hypothetical protein